MNPRKIVLLSQGIEVEIDPAQWTQVAGEKEFDKDSTAILRVFRSKKNLDSYYIYGMKMSGRKQVADVEAYEMTPIPAGVNAALNLVAKHCELGSLRDKISL